MEKTLYLECNSGISGDMFVAALLDLGADEAYLRENLKKLPLTGYEIVISKTKKAAIEATDFNVKLAHDNHDHDMQYLHGTKKEEADQPHHFHEHRNLQEIQRIIRAGALDKKVEELALRIFSILGQAEAKAHGVTPEEVHFHEVGAVDSIVDIVAAALCMENLQMERVIIPRLCEGYGTVRTQHGILPIPVPAVQEILKTWQLPLSMIDCEGEFITPTGAAIAAAVITGQKLPETVRIVKSGNGAGKREYERPSLLRAMILETTETAGDENKIVKLETNIDDASGEMLGYVLNRLLEEGARDAYFVPVYMKKNRPAVQINVICMPDDVATMEAILFQETTTIGIRRAVMDRTILPREIKTVQTLLGEAKVKQCSFRGKRKNYPEYESVTKLAKENDRSWEDVFYMVKEAAYEQYRDH